MKPVFYFETSAINYLHDHLDDNALTSLRDGLHLINGAKICLSPVTMWEIACTSDSIQKDALIRTCQMFFDNFWIFPGPISIMDHYISAGCPINEPSLGFFEQDNCFNKVWREIASDLSMKIELGGGILQFEKPYMKTISKLIETLIKTNFQHVDSSNIDHYNEICDLINSLYSKIPFICHDCKRGLLDRKLQKEYKTSIFFACCLLIMGISFDNYALNTFWKDRVPEDSIMQQLDFLCNNCETIFHRGPIPCMSAMALSQTEQKSNRGLYKDCLHAMYLPYCSTFFTNDDHFIKLSKHTPKEFYGRIHNIESFCNTIIFHKK